jgi:exopolysaccharide biosynthesis polyprenyl glycosylphosphotransferase
VDATAMMLCVTIAFQLHYPGSLLLAPLGEIAPFIGGGIIAAWALLASRDYRDLLGGPAKAWGALMTSFGALSGCFLAGATFALFTAQDESWRWAALGLGAGAALVMVLHAFYCVVLPFVQTRGGLSERVALVGLTDTAARLVQRAQDDPQVTIVGVFHDRDRYEMPALNGVPVLGDVMDLLSWRGLSAVDRIVVCIDPLERARLAAVLKRVITLPHAIALAVEAPRYGDRAPTLEILSGVPVAIVSGGGNSLGKRFLKRLVDIVGSAAALVALLPLFVLIAALVKQDSPGPVLFGQKRFGLNNSVFKVWKFRTMVHQQAPAQSPFQQVGRNDPRVTPFGAFLRRTSLDELPQLINVLLGQMSLVGPRPHAVDMLVDGIDPFARLCNYAHRHRVKPGMTGLAQVRGSRGAIADAEALETRLEWDLEYVRTQSFWLDLWLMLKTAPIILSDRSAVR